MSSPEGAGAAPAEEQAAPAPAAPTTKAPVRYCAVYDCLHNFKTHPHLSFFGFPNDKQLVKIWAEKIRRPDIVQSNGLVSSYYRVCEAHFEPRHINSNLRRRRLLRRAVPALRLPHAGPYVSVAELAPPAPPARRLVRGRALVRSTLEIFEYVDAPKRKTKRRQRDDHGLSETSSPAAAPPALEDFSAECDRHLAPGMAEFVKLVARLRQGDADGLNELCLKLLHTGPRAYRLLRAALSLPTIRSLHRHCAPILPDFDAKLTELLKMKVDRMTEKEKRCTLGVEFVEVRPHLYYNITFDRIVGLHEIDSAQSPWPAVRVAVVSARGLLASWTQPVALCYLARDDAAFDGYLDRIIRGLIELGLVVHALVSDPAAPARAPADSEHFFHVGDAKIYRIYDPPGLMKMLLCDFMTYHFHFEKTIAKWSDVLEYRKMERHKQLTLTPELTDAATDPVRVRRMRPARAARVLSRAMAAALSSYADRGQLPDTARASVNLILKINTLYDILDSTTTRTTSDFKKGLFNNPGQIGFLEYMKSFFKSLKLEDNFGTDRAATKRLRDGWQITIASVLALHEDLHPLKAPLPTRRLHLDDKVGETARRSRGLRHGKPTCRQAFVAFKRHFLDAMLRPLGEERSDREYDLNGLLARVARAPAAVGARVPAAAAEAGDVAVRRREYRALRLPARGAATAAAAWLLRAARREHGACAHARRYTREPPRPDLLRLVRRLDEALAGALRQTAAPARALLRELLLDVHVLDCALPCECFPLERLKLLFLRLRLYHVLRHNQARFDACPDDAQFEIDTFT